MRVSGISLYVALLGILSFTQSALAANEAFGSLMLFLYNAYRFDVFATNGKPSLANQCMPQDSDGPASGVEKGCNFHGFLRHVLAAPYNPVVGGSRRISDPWMPTESEVSRMQDWNGLDAEAGYDAGKVVGSSGSYFNSHLMFRVVATRVKKLAASNVDGASAVYGGMLDSVDRIQFSLRADDAAQNIKTVETVLGADKGKLVKADVGGLYGIPGFKQVDMKATLEGLSGDTASRFRTLMQRRASEKLKNDKNIAFRDIISLRDELSIGAGGAGGDRCGGRNRDGDTRDRNDKNKKDEENQSCKRDKRELGLLDSMRDLLLHKRQANNCVTKTETTYVTQGHHYHTPYVACDVGRYRQACYHYRSVMSAQRGTDSMTIFTCNDVVLMNQDGRATVEWGSTGGVGKKPQAIAQHNYAWTDGLPAECERDEYPPRYFWPKASAKVEGKLAQRVRLIPRADNGPAGQLWKGFCDLVGPYGPMTKPKGSDKQVENVDLYLRARPAAVNKNLGADGIMTETTTSYIKTGRAVWSLQFEGNYNLPNDGLDDNPCLPDIVRGTDPGWALLTYDEFYDRNPQLQQYTALYKQVIVPAALPPLAPVVPPPVVPRRLRRGTRAEWDDVVVVDDGQRMCLNGGLGKLNEMKDVNLQSADEPGTCGELADLASVAENLDAVPTDVPAGEGSNEFIPAAESRQTASPELPVPTGA